MPARRLSVVLLMLCGMAVPAWPRTLTAMRADGLRMDGHLESAWFQAAPADSFVQLTPAGGAPATLETWVYVAYDADALWFGFLCLDPAPDSVRGRLLRRDNQSGSDFVDVYLDTFHDRRNAYWFTVTAAGVQSDGTLANETDDETAWDGLWQCATGRTDSGWVAEVRIPFSSIRHGGPRADGWGLNLARYIERRRESALWEPVDPVRGFRVSEMGTLTGLDDIAAAEHAEILPHAIGRWDAAPRTKWHAENRLENLGLSVKLVPGASWTADLAYQPDFAQVDVDDEVINLSDYPVFIEEKRPFFLELNNVFSTAPIQQFYSRRITDPDYGVRLSGQPGRVRGSVLAARDRGLGDTLRSVGVGRVLFNVGRASSIGLTGTALEREQFHARTAGFDARLRWGLRNQLTLAAAGVDRSDGPDEQPVEGRFGVEQDLKLAMAEVGLEYRGRDYNINDLGWGEYSNVLAQDIELQQTYLPRAGFMQSVSWELEGFRRALADGSRPAGGAWGRVYGVTRSNWHLGIGNETGTYYRRNYGLPGEPEYRDNFGLFTPQFHPYTMTWAWIYSDSRQPVEVQTDAQEGSFREGRRWAWNTTLVVKPRPNLDLAGTLGWQQVRAVADYSNYGVTDFRVWRLRARYSPTLALSFRGTVQWVEDQRELAGNFLLAWNWSPGSWFYLVYDELRCDRPDLNLRYADTGDRTLRAKLTWFYTMPLPHLAQR